MERATGKGRSTEMIRLLIAPLIAIVMPALTTAAAAQTPTATNYSVDEPMPRPAQAQLVWSDEFDNDALDTSKWGYDGSRNKSGWYNGELQYYGARPENVRVANGQLIIEARRETLNPRQFPDYGGQAYTSGKVWTKGKASWTYGYYEIRAKLPCARGTWPAIWMMPEGQYAWPDGGEIDIMEQVGSQPEVVHGTLHTALFVHTKGTQRGAELRVPGNCDAFHNYQLEWTPSTIRMGVDGRAYMKVRNDQPGGAGAWPFDHPFYLILNLAMGGNWAAAKGMDDAALPQRMLVDYVRVYRLPR
jgi:beta-glucanase (GH16 family)